MSAKKETKKDEKPKDEPKKDGAATEGAEGDAAAKPKSKKKLIIMIVVGLLVVGGGVAGLLMSGVLGGEEGKKKTEKSEDVEESDAAHGEDEEEASGHGAEEAGDEAGAEEGGAKSKVAKSVFLDLPDIVANLSSPTPRPHFINLKLTLEIASKKDLKTIEDQMPRIKDAFNSYLREIRKEDLEGSAGMYRLENELMLRLEKLFGKDKVKDILFREIIVQ